MTGMWISPIAVREMRARMRGPRAFIILVGYLLLLALVIYLVYLRSGGGSSYSYPSSNSGSNPANLGPTISFQIGQNIFLGIFLFLLLVVSLITPIITAGAISREVEGRTYELLLLTPAHGRVLAFGKLFAAMAFVLCLLLSALPLTCIVFVFGGVDIANIAVGMLILFLTALVYGVIGLFFSTLFRRTALALVFTYCLIVLLMAGTWLVSSSMVSLINQDQKTTSPNLSVRYNANTDPAFDLPKRVLLINPLAALGSVLAPNAPYRGDTSEDLQLFPNSAIFGGNVTRYFAVPSYVRYQAATNNITVIRQAGAPLWAGYVLVYVILALVFWLFTLGVLRPQRKSKFLPAKKLPPTRTNQK